MDHIILNAFRQPSLFRNTYFALALFAGVLLRGTSSFGEDSETGDQALAKIHALVLQYMATIPTSGVLQIQSSYSQKTPLATIQIDNGVYRKELFGNGCFFVNLNTIKQADKNNKSMDSGISTEKVLFNGASIYILEEHSQVLPSKEGDVSLKDSKLTIQQYDPRKLPFAAAAFGLPCQNLELLQNEANGIGGFLATVLSKKGSRAEFSIDPVSGYQILTAEAENANAGPGNSQTYSVKVTFNPSKGNILEGFEFKQAFTGNGTNYSRTDNLQILDCKEITPGFWYPISGAYTTIVNGDKKLEYKFTIKSISIQSNKLIGQDDFLIPPYTKVHDLVNHIEFATGPKPGQLEEAIHQWIDK